MDFVSPPGVFDIVPFHPKDPWKHSFMWQGLESTLREHARLYGLKEIRTPIFEKTELFLRGIGETSDIVSKEMYSFLDKAERSLTLRPEGTAPTIRAFLENHLHNQGSFHKLFYIAPMFRYERAQAGRYRQHHQFGVEAIGYDSPEQDAEVIVMAYRLYEKLGLKGLKVSINSIGNEECRQKFKESLKQYLKEHFQELSKESQLRFEKNPLRILDSKDPKDKTLVAKAPQILEFLDLEAKDHLEHVSKTLNLLKIPYSIDPLLVRGLDYYNKTVFEIISEDLGAQNSIGGGGRYDGLILSLGGPNLPACGFGTGLERILQTMLAQNLSPFTPSKITLYLIPLGEKAEQACLQLQDRLRKAFITVQVDYSKKKLSKALQYADQLGATFTAVVGDEEITSQKVSLKEMSSGEVFKASFSELEKLLRLEQKSSEWKEFFQEVSKPFESSLESEFFIKKLFASNKEASQTVTNMKNAFKKIEPLLESGE